MRNKFATWCNDPTLTDPLIKWDMIYKLYTSASLQFIPPKRKQGAFGRNKWMTREALQKIDTKNKKYKVWKKNKTVINMTNLRQASVEAVTAIRQAKFRFEKSIAEEVKTGETASFYAYLRSSTNIKEGVSRVIGPDGQLTTSSKDTAEVINHTFQSVFVKEGDGDIPQLESRYHGIPLDDVTFTIQEIHDIITHLKPSSAPGPCSFHPKVLIECADSLAEPLYHVFRDSLDTGIIPEIWRTANVSPIYKKGKKSDPLNYRPISLNICPM